MAGKIIKSGDGGASPDLAPSARMPAAPRRAVVDSEEFEAHTRAREIVAQAEAQAEEIRAQALAEREAALQEAREAGRQEGLAQVTELMVRAHRERGQMLEQIEPQAVQLAIKIAERIIGRELDVNEDAALQIATKAIEQVRQQKELAIRVNPTDARVLRENKRRLLDHIGRLKDIAIREDPEIARGGCVIETESGTVDAQLSTQLELLERALLEPR